MDGNNHLNARVDFVRPDNFIPGEAYFLIERQSCPSRIAQEIVRFVGYAPCPATVVVLDGDNHRFYVPRENLFSGVE